MPGLYFRIRASLWRRRRFSEISQPFRGWASMKANTGRDARQAGEPRSRGPEFTVSILCLSIYLYLTRRFTLSRCVLEVSAAIGRSQPGGLFTKGASAAIGGLQPRRLVRSSAPVPKPHLIQSLQIPQPATPAKISQRPWGATLIGCSSRECVGNPACSSEFSQRSFCSHPSFWRTRKRPARRANRFRPDPRKPK